MHRYTVSQLARMAGVTPRTLHYYDQIGLLRPSQRTQAGYRLYTAPDLYRLQQILLYRELELPLEEIRQILDDPEFDLVQALQAHRQILLERQDRLARLVHTIDRSIDRIKEVDMTLTDDELYAGLNEEQRERYPREARAAYGEDAVEKTEQRIRALSKREWEDHQAEGGRVTVALAELIESDPSDRQVQALIARHHAWIEGFYPADAALYRGLGEMYTTHPEFRAFYEKIKPGLAEFMQAAMAYFADHNLA